MLLRIAPKTTKQQKPDPQVCLNLKTNIVIAIAVLLFVCRVQLNLAAGTKAKKKAKMVKKTQLKVLRISRAAPQVFPGWARLISCDKSGCNVRKFNFDLEKAAKLSLKVAGASAHFDQL